MSSSQRNRTILALLLPLLLAGGCILQFGVGIFQSIQLHFALSETLPGGEETLLHTITHEGPIETRKNWIRVSGFLMAPEGESLPNRIVLRSPFEDGETGRRFFQLRKASKIADDGSFTLRKKIRKNVDAGTVQSIFVEPRGGDLVEGTAIWLCIDIVQKRKDLKDLPDCAIEEEDDDDGSGDDGSDDPSATTTVVEVLDNRFEPQRVRVDPGDTVRWELAGLNLNHTVTAKDASLFDSGFLDTPGAFFEVTFTEAQRDQTFEYACLTHQACCAMQGSIQVGENAPDPSIGY